MSGGERNSSATGDLDKIKKEEEGDIGMEVNDMGDHGQRQRMRSPSPTGEENCVARHGKERHSSKGQPHSSRRTKGSHSRNVKPGPPLPKIRLNEAEAGQVDNSRHEPGQDEGEGLLEDLLDGDMEPQVSQLLTQLSSQIHHRVQAKKQRLGQHFQAVFSIPARILALQTEQRADRERMMTEFKAAAVGITEKLNDAAQLQLKHEEKQGKMVGALNRENDEMKKLITECNELQRACFAKFTTADKTLSKQMETEATQDADVNGKNIILLQKKLLADGQKEGSEALFNFHRLI